MSVPKLEQFARETQGVMGWCWRVYCPDCAWNSGTLPFFDPDAALHCLTLHKVLCKGAPSKELPA